METTRAGLAPMEVLKAAIWNGAYALGRTDQHGSVQPGKLADFVVLDANPVQQVSNVVEEICYGDFVNVVNHPRS
jgi:imidazolonepropionase-like amidohydrolase